MNMILLQVQKFLQDAGAGPVELDEKLIKEFGEACKKAVRAQLTEERNKDRTLRMSSVGRPTCQLQLESKDTPKEPHAYNDVFRNLFGHLIEAAAIMIMKGAGVNIDSEHEKVKLDIGGISLSGEYDVVIDGKLYDIKSASPFAYANKFDKSFQAVVEHDDFGYVSQGYGYAEASGKPFGGWIVINKVTGEWTICETPLVDDKYRAKALEDIDATIRTVKSDAPFKKCFTDEEETYRKKPTGNRVLGFTCGYCPYKGTCWPTAQLLPAQMSKGATPKLTWYTHVENSIRGTDNDGSEAETDRRD